eukprot:snap_masked-scaffold_10-processed-gene-7.24-mRNA-1 protein AED:1.00 eAED:1.00 QI:0/0/0/0/1/1/2/0/64
MTEDILSMTRTYFGGFKISKPYIFVTKEATWTIYVGLARFMLVLQNKLFINYIGSGFISGKWLT